LIFEFSVEYHILRPRAKLNSAEAISSHEVVLRKIRSLESTAPGMEIQKVKKINTAFATAAIGNESISHKSS
jgi:hypothetical protein